jgi:hypothetical protein
MSGEPKTKEVVGQSLVQNTLDIEAQSLGMKSTDERCEDAFPPILSWDRDPSDIQDPGMKLSVQVSRSDTDIELLKSRFLDKGIESILEKKLVQGHCIFSIFSAVAIARARNLSRRSTFGSWRNATCAMARADARHHGAHDASTTLRRKTTVR